MSWSCGFFIVTALALLVFVRVVIALLRSGRSSGPYGRPRLPGRRGVRRYRMNRPARYETPVQPPVIPPPPLATAGLVCPNAQCRHENRSGARFCARCGTRLT